MNLSLKERKLILKWFDIAVECENLSDIDLTLYDKIRETVEEDVDAADPLSYSPRKKSRNNESYSQEEEELHYDMDEYSDEDKY